MRTTNKILIPAILSLCSFGFGLNVSAADVAPAVAVSEAPMMEEGIRFSCDPDRLGRIKSGMGKYLASLGISPDTVVTRADQTNGALVFTLNTPKDDSDTLRLRSRQEFAIHDSVVSLPAKKGKMHQVVTVSKKEILLALLQHGRLTEFSGESCNLSALKDLVGIRQNIVAWSENLNWVWPDGDAAEWNKKYWHRGTPLPGVPLHAAFDDIFNNQDKYSIGCYTAAKIIMVHGVLDYYRRVKKDLFRQKLVETILTHDQEPLVDVEPGKMWSFEEGFDPHELTRPGKILHIHYGVAPRNFVPGDWAYLLNSDPVSSRKTGYEGSNAIYLGRNRFADFYNDNRHAYTYRQKLDEVYQWRNGVFSRSRDSAKIQPLSAEGFEQLEKTPAEGGLVLDFRVFPIPLDRLEWSEIP